MEKLDVKRKQKTYLSPSTRVKIGKSKSIQDNLPHFVATDSTPSAEQLMHPAVMQGEGTYKDKTHLLTTDDLPPNWLDLMMKEARIGRGATSFMRALGLTKAGFETILTTSPEFREAYERCMLYCAEWWEDRGRDMASGEKGSAAVWIANMVNRFNWNSERKESNASIVSSNVNTNETVARELTQDELDKELEKRGLTLGLLHEKF